MKRIYIKKSPKWTIKKVSKHSLTIYKSIIILMALFTLWAYINRQVNKGGLVDPRVSHAVPQVMASEPVVIKCELGVPEYLECKAVNGEITHKQAEIMTAIAKAESGLREKAKNKVSSAKGVFQILSGSTWYDYGCKGEIYEWKDNTNCAIKIMKKSGFTPWETYNTGAHIKHLNNK